LIIPVEDYRFNMLVQSTRLSLSWFWCNSGLGKIGRWEVPSNTVLEMFGLQCMAYKANADGTFTEPKIKNLITTPFVDFDVVEAQTYYYNIKSRTSLKKLVIPCSSRSFDLQLGDGNGDFNECDEIWCSP
jgi:hypothetical protein